MATPTLILSTCGTSLLNNLAGNRRYLVTRHANARSPEDIEPTERDDLEVVSEHAQQRVHEASHDELAALSAELNGLLRYYGGAMERSGDVHWLIATDTWLGTAAASAIASLLEHAGHQAEVKRIQDLRTDDLAEFRSGMAELARMCAQEVRGHRNSRWRVVFNLTGGFKSAQGFMQALAMIYADESVYVFEGTNELLRLPRLPITLDGENLVRKHQRIFRRLRAGLPVTASEAAEVPESLLTELEGQVALSVWGETVWAEAGPALLRETLWEPVDNKLRFGPGFEKSVAALGPDRLAQINERLADLARHLSYSAYNLNRLDFKKLGTPQGNSTHECDAWSDQDAKRLFGHFEDGVFVLDALDKGLH